MSNRHPEGPVLETLVAGLVTSLHVKVGSMERIVGPEIGRAVLEDGDAVGILALRDVLGMGDAELGGWVRSLLEKAAGEPQL